MDNISEQKHFDRTHLIDLSRLYCDSCGVSSETAVIAETGNDDSLTSNVRRILFNTRDKLDKSEILIRELIMCQLLDLNLHGELVGLMMEHLHRMRSVEER